MNQTTNPALEPRLWTIVPAAGVGARMGSAVPKQYLMLGGQTIIEHTLQALLAHPQIQSLYLALDAGDEHWPQLALAGDPRIHPVPGGAERALSVLNALTAIARQAQPHDWVLVHDVARPCVRGEDLDRLLGQLWEDSVGGLLGVPVADTLKRADADGKVVATVDRAQVWRAYTPQMFRFGLLHETLHNALHAGLLVTDEASALEQAGYQPRLIEGHGDNLKITIPSDLALAQLIMAQRDALPTRDPNKLQEQIP